MRGPHETSTGVVSRIPELRKVMDAAKHPALLLVDTISSLGSLDYRHGEGQLERSLEALRGFADLELDVPFPDLPWGPAVSTIVDAEGAAAFRDLIESGGTRQLRAVSDRIGGYAGMMKLAVDYIDALRARVRIRAELDALLSRYDALVVPTRGGVAPRADREMRGAPTPAPSPSPAPEPERPSPPATIPAGNLAGVPAVYIPNGFGENGLPTSLQLLGRAFSETTLLAIADRYQQVTDWHLQHPPGVV